MVLAPMTRAFWDFGKPSIVAVNGLTVGGAANIALTNFHDFGDTCGPTQHVTVCCLLSVVCSTNARFMYPFGKLGFTPELGGSLMFPLIVGMAKARERNLLQNWLIGVAGEANDVPWGLAQCAGGAESWIGERCGTGSRSNERG